jgi:oxygen-dependent protoporphyrinogen oxidase
MPPTEATMSARLDPPRVAVIGGGIAGLVAAFHLRELSAAREFPLEVTLFERERTLARALGTIREDGFVMETGADSFISDKPWALDLARCLGLESELIGTQNQFRRVYVVHRGRLLEIPEGFSLLAPTRFWPVLKSPLFSLRGKLRMAFEPLVPRRKESGDESLGEFVTRRLGREVLDRVVQPLAGGIYTADPAVLSLQATMPRFSEMERRHGSLYRAFRAARAAGPAAPGATNAARWGLFVSFRRGMRTLVETLEARLGDSAGLGTAVTGMTRTTDSRRWQLRMADGSGMVADAVVLATPAFAAARLVAPLAPELARRLDGIRYTSAATVNFAWHASDCDGVPRGFGFVVPAIERRKIIAATFSSLKFADRAPEGKILMRAFLGGALQDRMMQLDDQEMVDAARDELRALLGIRAEPILARVRRWENSMPQYRVGHLARVAEIERGLAELPALALAGAAYRGVGVPDCVHSGEQAAEAVFSTLVAATGARDIR